MVIMFNFDTLEFTKKTGERCKGARVHAISNIFNSYSYFNFFITDLESLSLLNTINDKSKMYYLDCDLSFNDGKLYLKKINKILGVVKND